MSQAPGPDQLRLTTLERGNLVAYLDGELNEAESRAIATKLTQSATARREIEGLQKTWELLEHLPRARASDAFSERTLTEVRRFDEQGGKIETAFKHAAGRFAAVAAWALVFVAVAGASYAAARWAWPDPSARLVRELPVAEHLDEYRDVKDFDFLDALANSPDFSTD